MPGPYFCWRQLVASSLCGVLLVGCAAGGLSDEEANAPESDEADDSSSGAAASKDAGKDAGKNAPGATADAGAGKDAGSSTPSAGRDASSSSAGRSDAGAGSLPTIKCPSNLVCTSDISLILGALDPNVKSDTTVCAQSGLLPMPVSCKSDDECKSARLTSAKCTGSYCIQACTK